MRCTRWRKGWATGLICLAGMGVGGCASPPAVTPLLRVTQQALQAEARYLAEDAERDAQRLDQTRAALAAAYEADLRQAPALTADWVGDATRIYVAAREALVRHELSLKQARARRLDNLRAADEATGRAVRLLERQDRLITDVMGVDLWRWMKDSEAAAGEGRGFWKEVQP